MAADYKNTMHDTFISILKQTVGLSNLVHICNKQVIFDYSLEASENI